MTILLDMNVSLQWLATFRSAGFEAVHWSTLGAANAPDQEIMEFARATGYVIFTQDLDYGIALARSQSKLPSVIQVRAADIFQYVIGDRVIAAVREHQDSLQIGGLLSIDPKRVRFRKLPMN